LDLPPLAPLGLPFVVEVGGIWLLVIYSAAFCAVVLRLYFHFPPLIGGDWI